MSTYFTFKALESQRAAGYKNTTYALAELVDNSFDAAASECRVIFIEKRNADNKKYIDEIIIADDGEGMSDEILSDSLAFGGGVNTDIEVIVSKKKMGTFGFGLPNASLSQCPNIRVYSWTEKGKIKNTRLILEELRKQGSIEVPALGSEELPSHYDKVDACLDVNHGTIVSWKDCDRLSYTKAETIINNSEHLLGKIYRAVGLFNRDNPA